MKWELFSLSQLTDFDEILMKLYKQEVIGIVSAYERYRTALRNRLSLLSPRAGAPARRSSVQASSSSSSRPSPAPNHHHPLVQVTAPPLSSSLRPGHRLPSFQVRSQGALTTTEAAGAALRPARDSSASRLHRKMAEFQLAGQGQGGGSRKGVGRAASSISASTLERFRIAQSARHQMHPMLAQGAQAQSEQSLSQCQWLHPVQLPSAPSTAQPQKASSVTVIPLAPKAFPLPSLSLVRFRRRHRRRRRAGR